MIDFKGGTHPGNREHNEDCFVADNQLGLGLVADGMGGYACGEVASQIVKETVTDAIRAQGGLSEAIIRAHYLIKEAAKEDPGKQGMGSTVIAVKTYDNEYELAWVGDSRAYLWDGELKQITRDHSYVEVLLERGEITAEEAQNHPNKNLITQAVGAEGHEGLEVSLIQGCLGSRQQLLLCSDGLIDEVSDIAIAQILNGVNNQEEAIHTLIDAAVQAGGRDNITVVLARAEDTKDRQAQEPEVIRTTSPDGRSLRHDLLNDTEVKASELTREASDSLEVELVASSYLGQVMTLFSVHRTTIIGCLIGLCFCITLYILYW